MINNTLLDLKREINFSGGVTQESIVKLAEEMYDNVKFIDNKFNT